MTGHELDGKGYDHWLTNKPDEDETEHPGHCDRCHQVFSRDEGGEIDGIRYCDFCAEDVRRENDGPEEA